MRAMARAEPAAVVAVRIAGLLAQGMQPRWVQMPTMTNHCGSTTRSSSGSDPQRREVDRARGLDLGRRAMADEHRLAAPLRGDRHAFLDAREVDLDRAESEHVGGRIHAVDQGPHQRRRPDRRGGAGQQVQEIARVPSSPAVPVSVAAISAIVLRPGFLSEPLETGRDLEERRAGRKRTDAKVAARRAVICACALPAGHRRKRATLRLAACSACRSW